MAALPAPNGVPGLLSSSNDSRTMTFRPFVGKVSGEIVGERHGVPDVKDRRVEGKNVGGRVESDEVFAAHDLSPRGGQHRCAGEGVGVKRESGCGRSAADQRIEGDAGGNEQTMSGSLLTIITKRLKIFLTREDVRGNERRLGSAAHHDKLATLYFLG